MLFHDSTAYKQQRDGEYRVKTNCRRQLHSQHRKQQASLFATQKIKVYNRNVYVTAFFIWQSMKEDAHRSTSPFQNRIPNTHMHTEEAKALLKIQWENYMGENSGKGLGLCYTGQV